VRELEDLGYVPEGVVNWVALMGWSYDDRTEFFPLTDLIEKFSLDRLNPSPAAINFSKLDHFNGLQIRALSIPDLAQRIRPFLEKAGFTVDQTRLLKIAPIVQERLTTLDDVVDMAGFFFREEVQLAPERLVIKGISSEQSAEVAQRSMEVLSALPSFAPEVAEPAMRALVEELGLSAGQVFGQIREAITGQRVSPPLFETMEIIGKEAVIARLQQAIEILSDYPGSE
jgi:glutamyl-tRNA synthetase